MIQEIKLAQQMLLNNNLNGSISILEEAITVHPSNRECLELLAEVSFKAKLYSQCIKYNQLLLPVFEDKEHILIQLGVCYQCLFQNEEALYYLKESLKFGISGLANLILLYIQLKKQDDAIEEMMDLEYNICDAESEDKVLFFSTFATLYKSIKNPYQAFKCYEKAFFATNLRLDNIILDALQYFDISVEFFVFPWQVFEKSILNSLISNLPEPQDLVLTNQIYPLYSNIFMELGLQYLDYSNYAFALIAFLLAYNSKPSATPCAFIGSILLPLSLDLSELYLFYGSSLGEDAHLYGTLGKLYLKRNRLEEAMECFEKAIILNPKLDHVKFEMARIYKLERNFAKALEYLISCCESKPENVYYISDKICTSLFVCDWRTVDMDFQQMQKLLREFFKVPLNSRALSEILDLNVKDTPFKPTDCFTLPVSSEQLALISYYNSIIAIQNVHSSEWFPVNGYKKSLDHSRIRIGYVSSDFRDHSLSHLLQNMFKFQNEDKFEIFGYALNQSDGSEYRKKIEENIAHFRDCFRLSLGQICELIESDEIDILVDLNGFTDGRRTEIFAAKAAKIQMHYMGFPGLMSNLFMDYCIADRVVVPDSLSNFASLQEKIIYMPNTYFCTDHKQQSDSSLMMFSEEAWQSHELERNMLRGELFPHLSPNTIILGSFNQLYKLSRENLVWIEILQNTTNTIIWMLNFPEYGAKNLLKFIMNVDQNIVDRFYFTDLVPKKQHLQRAKVLDIFLDSIECNGHTTACDVLWNGVPLVTFPKYDYKFASRVATSIANATGYGHEMVVSNYDEYIQKVIEWVTSASPVIIETLPRIRNLKHQNQFHSFEGPLYHLKRQLFEERYSMPLFDTQKWVRNLERGFLEAFNRYKKKLPVENIYVREM
eukprot:NODE_34_length_36538_cov_0.612854.p2 type:complete len:885 gc:universal NODE_34_length_36538_cov_0.612854:29689-32343(+)